MAKLLREILKPSGEEHGISPDQFKSDLKGKEPVDYHHLHDVAQQHLTGDTSHIDSGMLKSISRYTQNSNPGYKEINGFLRNNANSPHAKVHAENLTKAIEGHSLPNSTWGYRGIHDVHAENLRKLKRGDVFHNDGITSTTLDPNRATHFARGQDILAVHMPKGQKALYLSHPHLNSWSTEREMALPPKTSFKYNGSEPIEAHEHDYTGHRTGIKKKFTLHHVEIIPHSNKSIAIDR